jgi:hypothetical protein
MTKLELKEWITELACSLDRGDLKIDELMNEVEEVVDKNITEQLTLTDVGNCPFEAYAVFCIECDRKGIKPIKHKDYLNLG